MNRKMAKSGYSIGMAAQVLRGIRASRLASWLRHSGSFSREEGSNLVESALAYAILIPLLVAAIQFGYMFYTYQVVADASRKAARWAAVHGSSSLTACTGGTASQVNCNASTTNITAYVQGLNYPGVTFTTTEITVSFWCVENSGNGATWVQATGANCPTGTDNAGFAANEPGGEVQVNVSYPFTIGYWKSLGMTVTINTTGSMVIEY